MSTADVVLELEDSGTQVTLRGVVSVDDAFVAVGDGGTILRRVGDGMWLAESSPSTADLHGVAVSASRVVAVGAGGTIVRSEVTAWVASDSGVVADLHAVAFATNDVVIAVGDGVVVRSEDRGETWEPVELPGDVGHLRAVAGDAGRAAVIAVGDGGAALHSRDLGVSWAAVDLGTRVDLRAIVHGFEVAGADGSVRVEQAPHDGRTWETHVLAEGVDLRGLAGDGWSVGADGSVRVEFLVGEFAWEDDPGRPLLAVAVHPEVDGATAVGEQGVVVRAELDATTCPRPY